jgi:hypothetical protein
MEKPRKVHWSELFGNPYLKNLHPDMLTESGYKTHEAVRLKGQSHNEDRIMCEVTFDEEYVKSWLKNKFFKPLKIAKWNEAQRVVSESYKVYMAEMGKVESKGSQNT